MDIQVKHLFKRFGDKVVFADVSAAFPQGKTTCVMGPSGCGKTTLLSWGWSSPTAGRSQASPACGKAPCSRSTACART